MKHRVIYTFTVVGGDPRKDRMRSRVWGYTFDRGQAEHIIETNSTDLAENGYYGYAVLGEVGEGPGAIPTELQWYRMSFWERTSGTFRTFLGAEKISKPDIYKKVFFGGI
jgi:hypothetical protein